MFGDLTCIHCGEAVTGKPIFVDGVFYCERKCFLPALDAFRAVVEAKKGPQA